MNEGFVYKILLSERNKIKPKFQVNKIIRLADLRKTFSKRNLNKLEILCKVTEIIVDTIPSYRIDNLSERYNETLLKKTKLIMREKKQL